ncbi:MAG: SUMF1/EgtB/PvdO family nonheme iron enzyme [Saprospiraceae bacterium]|nr:SUMF1/EgtB/PvdO family nonheme iron enzyme [Saprospiraceae bacterium]
MTMRTLALPLLILFFGLPGMAQDCPHFDRLMRTADTHWRSGEFDKALNQLAAAREHCPGEGKKVDDKLLDFTNKITRKYMEAEEDKQRADKALQNLQRIADQAVPIVLADIDRDIYRLEYDATYEKCKTAVGLNARRPEVEKRIWEIAYFYTEADTAAAAVAFLNLLRPTGLTAETPGLQDKLRAYLAVTLPSYYMDTLQERYYPKTLLVEGGAFWQEELEDTLWVEKPFHIAETEITYWQYNVFARAEKHHIEPPAWEYAGDNPAVYVSWYDAAFYCTWLSKRHGKGTVYTLTNPRQGTWSLHYDVKIDTFANGYRLPTEAQWEFAARGGNYSMGYEYSGDSVLTNVAWYSDNSNNRTRAVKLKKTNELGLYDMSGNVWEWCADWYDEGSSRVIRGGSWGNSSRYCRSASRSWGDPGARTNLVGFRLVFVPQ